MRYTLRDVGIPAYKKIMRGKNWVGRVGPTADGRYFGKIGKLFVYAATSVDAFDLVVARHLGYDSVAELNAHNRRVRGARRQASAAARHVAAEWQAGNFAPLMALLDKMGGK